MGSFVAIAFTADFVISTAQRGITDDYARRFMRGTITLIEDELFRHPRRDLAEKDQGNRRKILLSPGYRRAHHARPDPDRRSSRQARCRRHRHRPRRRHHVPPPRHEQQGIGGRPAGLQPQSGTEGPPAARLRLRLLTWSLIGVIFGIALWFWVRPVWRDLEALRQTARDLGDGDFDARSPSRPAASSLPRSPTP
jgi:hypothetical protein